MIRKMLTAGAMVAVCLASVNAKAQEIKGDAVAAIVGDSKVYVSDVMEIYQSSPDMQVVPFKAIYDRLAVFAVEGKVVADQARKEGL